jgi:hypothetical protein
VTITGNHFSGVTGVGFNGAAATSFTVASNTQLRATVPAGATTGKISVTNANGTGMSAADFTVTGSSSQITFNPTDDAETKSSFATTNYGANSIMRVRDGSVSYRSFLKFNVSGLSGSVQRATLRLYVDEGGDDRGRVYLVSNNYAGTSTAWTETGIFWDNAPAMTGTPVSQVGGPVATGMFTEFDVTAAITGNGTYSFGLLNASTSTPKYCTKEGVNPPQLVIETTSTPPQTPVITSFAPTSGAPGTQVTITGSNFTGVTNVAFNGTAAATLTVDSNTQIRATVPAGAATGKITVTNSAGSAQSATNFTVNSTPSTFTFAPVHDAYVRLSSPAQSYGSTSSLLQRLTDGETIYTYLKFNVTGVSGTIQSAKLRLYVNNAGDDGGSVHAVSNNYIGSADPWAEGGLNWGNAPTITGTALSAAGAVIIDTFIELDVTAAITGNGVFSFGLKNASSDAVGYSSKEDANPPQLVIVTGSSSAKSAGTSTEAIGFEVAAEDLATSLPERLVLHPNHPNPFNAQTTIEYTLPLSASVQLEIFNIYGQAVRQLVRGAQSAGRHQIVWDGKNEQGKVVGSGIYYYRLKVDNEIRVRQMTILK